MANAPTQTLSSLHRGRVAFRGDGPESGNVPAVELDRLDLVEIDDGLQDSQDLFEERRPVEFRHLRTPGG